MTISRFLIAALSVLVSTLCFATDEEGEILLADLEGIQLSLGGSPHYYWLNPEMGRIVLTKACLLESEDCDHEVFVVWDDTGTKIFDRAPICDLPEMKGNRVQASTLVTPRRLTFSTVIQRDSWVWVLAQYDLDSQELVYVIPSKPITCQDLDGDADGTIWCVGDNHEKRKNKVDYDLVYRFDHAGNFMSSTLTRSSFPEEPPPLTHLKSRSGYGGFLPGDGETRLWLPTVGELISFDSKGQVARRLTLPTIQDQHRAWLVSAPSDEVYALLISGANPDKPKKWIQSLYRLASDGSSWIPLHDPPITLPMRISLQGADDKGLILLDRKSLELLWYPYEATQTE